MNEENSTTVPTSPQPESQSPEAANPDMKRRPGGQPGNRNALKHGFYSKKASPEQQQAAIESEEVDGLDQEIELLRRKIRHLEETKPDEAALIAELIRTLSLVMSRRRYAGRGPLSAISDTAKKMLENVILPAGIIKDALDKMGVFKE